MLHFHVAIVTNRGIAIHQGVMNRGMNWIGVDCERRKALRKAESSIKVKAHFELFSKVEFKLLRSFRLAAIWRCPRPFPPYSV